MNHFQIHRSAEQGDFASGYDWIPFHGKPVITMGRVSFPKVTPSADLMPVDVADLPWLSFFDSSTVVESVRVEYQDGTEWEGASGLYAVIVTLAGEAGEVHGVGESLREALRELAATIQYNGIEMHLDRDAA